MEARAIVIVEDDEPVARLLQEVLNDEPSYWAAPARDRAAGSWTCRRPARWPARRR
jgi:hypothetical protein